MGTFPQGFPLPWCDNVPILTSNPRPNGLVQPYLLRTITPGTPLSPGEYTYTKLLLHCNGADAGTTFTDECGKTVTAGGNAQLDTAVKKFGTASALFDGNGDYLQLADSADWDFGSGDFTIDFQVYFNSFSDVNELICRCNDGSDCNWNIYWHNAIGAIMFISYPGGPNYDVSFHCHPTININTWYHIEVGRNGSTWYVFVDGTSKALTLDGGAYANSLPDTSEPIYIGESPYNSSGIDGWIDEIRISKGICRHTSNFTSPSAEYTYDEAEIPATPATSTLTPKIMYPDGTIKTVTVT